MLIVRIGIKLVGKCGVSAGSSRAALARALGAFSTQMRAVKQVGAIESVSADSLSFLLPPWLAIGRSICVLKRVSKGCGVIEVEL